MVNITRWRKAPGRKGWTRRLHDKSSRFVFPSFVVLLLAAVVVFVPLSHDDFYLTTRNLLSTTKVEKPMIFDTPKTFRRTAFTFTDFQVAGVNLATYGLAENGTISLEKPTRNVAPPFELFDTFNLRPLVSGQENWVDLLRYRRDSQQPALSFYVDKIALKRWLPATNIPTTQTHVLRYATEIVAETENLRHAIRLLIPDRADYAAKSTHLSCSEGVWLTKTDHTTNVTWVGHGKKKFKPMRNFHPYMIVESLVKDLHKQQILCNNDVKESWALAHVKPGILVEQRITSWEEEDTRGGMEFKVFTIWGRVFLAVWRPGLDGVAAFVHRNRTLLEWSGKSAPLPEWLDWPRIVDMAETLGAHKDMFRTDIFVGLPAGAAPEGAVVDERIASIEYIVSETEIHPTPLAHTEEIFDEAGRLWLAGYAMGNYRIVHDTQVPKEFLQTGKLSAFQ